MEQNYLGNPNLKKANVQQEWTKEELQEYKRCMDDPQYFVENYIMIVSLDEGLVPFKLYDFQKEMIGTFHNNRFTICKLPRQSGKSTTIIAYLLHYVLFNQEKTECVIWSNGQVREWINKCPVEYRYCKGWNRSNCWFLIIPLSETTKMKTCQKIFV